MVIAVLCYVRGRRIAKREPEKGLLTHLRNLLLELLAHDFDESARASTDCVPNRESPTDFHRRTRILTRQIAPE